MADVPLEKDIRYIISITGARLTRDEINKLTDSLLKNNKSTKDLFSSQNHLEKTLNKANKEAKIGELQFKKLLATFKSCEKETRTFNISLKGIGDKFMDLGKALIGINFTWNQFVGNIVDYNKEAVRVARVTGLLGTSFSKTQDTIKRTANELGMSRQSTTKLYNEFARTNMIVSGSSERFESMTKTLKSRLGPALEDIEGGLRDLNALYNANYSIASKVEKGIQDINKTGLSYYMVLTEVNGVSADLAIRSLEIANGMKNLKDEELEEIARKKESIEVTQQFEASLQDIKLVLSESVFPVIKAANKLFIGLRYVIEPVIEYIGTALLKLEKISGISTALDKYTNNLKIGGEIIKDATKAEKDYLAVGKQIQSQERHTAMLQDLEMTEEAWNKLTAAQKASHESEFAYDQKRKQGVLEQIKGYNLEMQFLERIKKADQGSIDSMRGMIDLAVAVYGADANIAGMNEEISKLYSEQYKYLDEMVALKLKANKTSQEEAKKELARIKNPEEYGKKVKEINTLERERESIIKQAEAARDTKKLEQYRAQLELSTMALEKESAVRDSITDTIESEMMLQEKLYFGVGATLQKRLEVVNSLQQGVKLVDAQIAATKEQIAAGTAEKDAEIKLNQLTAKRNQMIARQVDMTKELREGYLQAIESFGEGAGEFTKIIQRQDEGARDLMQTMGMAGAMALGGMGGGLKTPMLKYTAEGGVGGALSGQAPGSQFLSKTYYGGGPVGYGAGSVGTAMMTETQMQTFEAIGKAPGDIRKSSEDGTYLGSSKGVEQGIKTAFKKESPTMREMKRTISTSVEKGTQKMVQEQSDASDEMAETVKSIPQEISSTISPAMGTAGNADISKSQSMSLKEMGALGAIPAMMAPGMAARAGWGAAKLGGKAGWKLGGLGLRAGAAAMPYVPQAAAIGATAYAGYKGGEWLGGTAPVKYGLETGLGTRETQEKAGAFKTGSRASSSELKGATYQMQERDLFRLGAIRDIATGWLTGGSAAKEKGAATLKQDTARAMIKEAVDQLFTMGGYQKDQKLLNYIAAKTFSSAKTMPAMAEFIKNPSSDPDMALIYARSKFDDYMKEARSESRKMASGGRAYQVPGQGNQDTVPAMLTPGELVVPAKHADAVNSIWQSVKNSHDGGYINSNSMQRFQNGGVVASPIATTQNSIGINVRLEGIGPAMVQQAMDKLNIEVRQKIRELTSGGIGSSSGVPY